ncbi:glutamine--fructose-6-phosphate transaminase (isomerizing) [Serpentinicella alkaliphila]|uniref:Glutamine--fructose-6-phosphate aminotransferase [isomerizing] n=1 Tax=Serpentinicella alkaliphila TaxID=1734049 RepID=A0A4R2TI22_9FIRM|nr:glutamine--fructose-6-phosphate transaminase (isomerizing) [Serpentinicella alkaliphila]QUH25540.1 glutamine--fructose-6-phosphate transaminase (isomerizing) [Serpentinicella alkaliphila]TCQ01892.1 glutamine--fructose-6-phosphate transaminase [Serpentinicella alkaliphila]
MCGIVGYIGRNEATPILIEGLEKLEYRGYDSAGVAVYNNDEITVRKFKGRLKVLEENLNVEPLKGTLGIGHTRWATHGEPNDVNAHPHTNVKGDIAVVHNGIIENYLKLKDWLIKEGKVFISETDTEVIAHLIDYYYEGNLVDAVQKAVRRMEGAYAIGVISKKNPDKLVAVRKDSPLVVGVGEGENFIASDIPALLKYTRKVYFLEDGEMVILDEDNIQILNEFGVEVKKEIFEVTWDVESAEKGGYEHFMIKEIHEQPKAIKDTLSPRLGVNNEIELDNIKLSKEDLEKINKVVIVACGTAYHAGLVGRYAIEKFAKIPVETDVASEFRYRDPFVDDKTLFIAVSQSGETADTLAALREAKGKGARVLAVTNVVGSRISREADDVFYTWAGPEIAVASTKAYTTQLVAMYLIALNMGIKKGTISKEKYNEILEELKTYQQKVEKLVETKEQIQELANRQFNNQNVFYIGRGIDDHVGKEGSLKLKEISYIHSEAIAAGELKHGTIALIEQGTLVIALATQEHLFDKMLSNIKEVKARGAYVIAVAKEGNEEIEEAADAVIYIPNTLDELTPILSVIPLQLLAYYIAVTRGCDVDKPKNLAKSVTVE